MIKIVCAVRDLRADVYANPFVSQNVGTAMRDFSHACIDPQSQLSKSPEDYMLFKIGEYDDELGIIIPTEIQLIANATQFVKE